VVVLANKGVKLVQFFTRLVILKLPRPVASLYPALWLKANSKLPVELEMRPYASVEVFV
jgi:hypothetical protein